MIVSMFIYIQGIEGNDYESYWKVNTDNLTSEIVSISALKTRDLVLIRKKLMTTDIIFTLHLVNAGMYSDASTF